ncbi:MAG: PKD domain-containing protein, partial [Bacteroidales bacterium]
STQARFTFTVSNGAIAPATVSFSNKSINATSYLWDFGNGETSTEENPELEYTLPGTYSVKLTVGTDNADLYYNNLVAEAEIVIRDEPVKKLFFSDRSAGNIKYVALDDSPLPVLQGFEHTGLGRPYGMAIDTVTGKVYVTDAGDGIIYSYDNDGSNLQILIDFNDPHLDLPYGINVYDGMLYWADQEGIIRANLDGTGSEVFIPVGTDSPPELAIDFTIDHINNVLYFTNDKYDYSGGVYKVNMDGSGMTKIVDGTDGGAMAIDPENDRLYYYDYLKGMCINNLEGTNEVVFDPTNAGMFTWGMAIDKEGGKIYYPNRVSMTVMSANLDGSGVSIFIPAEAEINPNAMAIDTYR